MAVIAALVGRFVVLRRESFVCHTLSVMSFPGASSAALAGLPLASGYFVFAVGGALAIAFGSRVSGRRSATQESAVVGTVGAVALDSAFSSCRSTAASWRASRRCCSARSSASAAVRWSILLVVALLAAAVCRCRWAPALLRLGSTSRPRQPTAYPWRALSIVFLVLLELAVAAIAQIVGVLLTFPCLVAPAATAQLRQPRVCVRSLALWVVLAVLETWVALTLSYFTNEALGFCVTTIALVLYARGAPLQGGKSLMFALPFVRNALLAGSLIGDRKRSARVLHRPARPGLRRRCAQPRRLLRHAGRRGRRH